MRRWSGFITLAALLCAVAVTSDGARIASGGADGTIRLWGPGGRLIATLSEETRP